MVTQFLCKVLLLEFLSKYNHQLITHIKWTTNAHFLQALSIDFFSVALWHIKAIEINHPRNMAANLFFLLL